MESEILHQFLLSAVPYHDAHRVVSHKNKKIFGIGGLVESPHVYNRIRFITHFKRHWSVKSRDMHVQYCYSNTG